jgi:NADPH:quinone reductase-like Zn-dependent oxidoreductase
MQTMKAVVLERACSARELRLSTVPIPAVIPGWVLIKVMAFGINRSELTMRTVEANSPYIQLPRIPGIECAGEIVDPSDSGFSKGQRVVALMGGMGRSFDGSYAQYALLPYSNVFAVGADLSWEELAAIPETYFTAYGSLFDCLQLDPANHFLVRGATSALGLASVQLAKSIGSTILGTTRQSSRLQQLRALGVDLPLLDNAALGDQIRSACPEGVDKILELVGPATLRQSMSWLRYHGIVCCTGVLGHQFSLDAFDPIKFIPNGVYLSSFFSNFPKQSRIDAIFRHLAAYKLRPVISQVFRLDQIGLAHELMENDNAVGNIVITVEGNSGMGIS